MEKGVVLKPRAVLRGDGQDIKIGRGVMFLSRSTVHIANDLLGAVIGDYSVIGRYSLIHACTIGKSVLVGHQAVIMDGSVLGDECLVTANSLIPPGKRFSNNVIIDGAPAKVIGTIKKDQLKIYKEEKKNSNYSKSGKSWWWVIDDEYVISKKTKKNYTVLKKYYFCEQFSE